VADFTPDEIADGLLAATLPKEAWTHAAHVRAAHVLVSRHGPRQALVLLRAAIPRLNESHGVANDDTGGYHETLTVYFAAAVADCVARGLDADGTLAALPRDAPLSHWSRETLFSVDARRRFVPPDLEPPAFPLHDGT
jgi:hypothetical protein